LRQPYFFWEAGYLTNEGPETLSVETEEVVENGDHFTLD
jgi:hypothetical protein